MLSMMDIVSPLSKVRSSMHPKLQDQVEVKIIKISVKLQSQNEMSEMAQSQVDRVEHDWD